ncbi:GSU2403 family nucleotidyltransferase fold protein [Bradyrhizobium sp. CCGUVB14]|uniref:GSU2403 family nucleotidyltransferase fold protein n=1 Tax=Bradyrhizobium sp. CCGUVB14 TaxID=2949628 RepID=UPI00281174B3|nr:GSU2403 family nucleotidyltransferase fold protein [Bradyrhizobium sp. CCGUVB14]
MSINLETTYAGPFLGFPDDLCRASRAHCQRRLPGSVRGRRRIYLQDCQAAKVLVFSNRHGRRAVPTLCRTRDARTVGKNRAPQGNSRRRARASSACLHPCPLAGPTSSCHRDRRDHCSFRSRWRLSSSRRTCRDYCQTYAAMLGLRLPSAGTITMDIAQFTNVSVSVGDRTTPVLDVLKQINKSFRPVSNVVDGRRATSYSATGGLRVDFLTPDDHTETGRPKSCLLFKPATPKRK